MDIASAIASIVAIVSATGVGKVWVNQNADRKRCQENEKALHDRVMSLEIKNDIGFPMWRKSFDGTYTFVNAEYVRMILMPFGKSANDIVGKKDQDVAEFNPTLKDILRHLDETACV